jgi:hypothetical protein
MIIFVNFFDLVAVIVVVLWFIFIGCYLALDKWRNKKRFQPQAGETKQ